MQIKFESIQAKEKISSDQIIEDAVRIGHRVLSKVEGYDFKDCKIRVQKLKKNSNPSYFGTVLLMLVTKDDSFSASFDLTVQELKRVSFKLESSWDTIAKVLTDLKPGVTK